MINKTAIQQPFFYNRARELKVLKETLNSSQAELVILYGRRGVGKSSLLQHALTLARFPSIFYRATRRTLPLQLEALSAAAREAYPNVFLAEPFQSLSAFLDFLVYLAQQQKHPVIFILDELSYLADVEPGLTTMLQHWWDANKRQSNLKIFLAGSYVTFMERQVLDVNAPLYNRRTGAIKLEPMDYSEAALFFPNYAPEEKMETYAILGGMPSYLEQFDPNQSIERNVKLTILRQNTYLSEEPDWLLLEDLRRDVLYGSILRAVAVGNRKPSDIAQAIGKNSAQDIAPHLITLQELGLLLREVPLTERKTPRSRNSLYFIADHYLNFWYQYVDPARSLVTRGLGDRIWKQVFLPTRRKFVSRPAFELACQQYLWKSLEANHLPKGLKFVETGRWWNSTVELDAVGKDEQGKIVLACSCKWTERAMDVKDYAGLQQDLDAAKTELRLADDPWIILFSRAGFTSRLISLAKARKPNNLLLIDLARMYKI